jgi:hypothetical protein
VILGGVPELDMFSAGQTNREYHSPASSLLDALLSMITGGTH